MKNLEPISLYAMYTRSILNTSLQYIPSFTDEVLLLSYLHVTQIMEELFSDRLNAVEALQKHRKGVIIGHTVVVMASVLKGARSRR